MEEFFVFRAAEGIQQAIIDDRTGARLPPGRWVFDRVVRNFGASGAAIGADPDEVRASIQQDGFYIWPAAG
jgi:hypothetical protein